MPKNSWSRIETNREIGPCNRCGQIRELTKYDGKNICLLCWLQITEEDDNENTDREGS
jgi:hypothetical protein